MWRLYIIGFLLLGCSQSKPDNAFKFESFVKTKYTKLYGIAYNQEQFQVVYFNNNDTQGGPVFYRQHLPKRIVVLSSVFAGYFEALNQTSKIIGVDRINYYSHPDLLKAYALGQIHELGEEGQLNEPELYDLMPDLIVASSAILKQSAVVKRCQQMHIPILVCDNYLEQNPLARAEWIKVFGYILGLEAQSNTVFNQIDSAYQSLKTMNQSILSRPKVLTDALYSDAWNVPGGNSYTAQLIQDAGGEYVFKPYGQRFSYAFNLEFVLNQAYDADVWIHMNRFKSKADILKADDRYKIIKAFQLGHLFNNHKRELNNGANDFWEMGSVRPDWVLKDLTWIMAHPNKSNDKLYFYQKVD